ncbi:hypothetical protein ACG2LH_13585 [Zhouia sp. PK063]|uniref:hypothetical protein n=1 Tax=Zhouia sp. PK063 TaxID=3373602 RepID=UPI00379409DA
MEALPHIEKVYLNLKTPKKRDYSNLLKPTSKNKVDKTIAYFKRQWPNYDFYISAIVKNCPNLAYQQIKNIEIRDDLVKTLKIVDDYDMNGGDLKKVIKKYIHSLSTKKFEEATFRLPLFLLIVYYYDHNKNE